MKKDMKRWLVYSKDLVVFCLGYKLFYTVPIARNNKPASEGDEDGRNLNVKLKTH